ncbi:uncharacterized protein [Prorops nasuta]|uniref:uncharacterized protein isoform X2 n=1 Tax=Prorops nasuta TaxID=863751 RepID=UPI0034CFBE79
MSTKGETMESAVLPQNLVENLWESIDDTIVAVLETVGGNWLGRFFLRIFDKFFAFMEKTAQWCSPKLDCLTEGNGSNGVESEQPPRQLAWAILLPGILIFRSFKGFLNAWCFLIGYDYFESADILRIFQGCRKRLDFLRPKLANESPQLHHGPNRKMQNQRVSMNEAKKALIRSIRLTLSTLSCIDGPKPSLSPPPMKIQITGLDLDATPSSEEKSTTESAPSPVYGGGIKRKQSNMSSDEESEESKDENFDAKLERLALINSSEDEDFNPNSTLYADDTCSEENEEDKDEEKISLTEILDIIKEAAQIRSEVDNTLVEPNLIPENKDGGAQLSWNQNNQCSLKTITEEQETCENSKVLPKREDGIKLYPKDKVSQDRELDTFYSPISSKSSSPARSTVNDRPEHLDQPSVNVKEVGNGAINVGQLLTEETSNGVAYDQKRSSSTNANKIQHKGKRTNHGNRKKK